MKKISIFLFLILYCLLGNANVAVQSQDKRAAQIKLYAINCGRIDVSSFAKFSDTGDYDNKSIQLVDPCFLIIHPKGVLL